MPSRMRMGYTGTWTRVILIGKVKQGKSWHRFDRTHVHGVAIGRPVCFGEQCLPLRNTQFLRDPPRHGHGDAGDHTGPPVRLPDVGRVHISADAELRYEHPHVNGSDAVNARALNIGTGDLNLITVIKAHVVELVVVIVCRIPADREVARLDAAYRCPAALAETAADSFEFFFIDFP